MVRLVEENAVNTVAMKDLKDGQIAIIVEDIIDASGQIYADYKGRIVQRFENKIVALGMHSDRSWSNADRVTLRVRILTVGETLIIE